MMEYDSTKKHKFSGKVLFFRFSLGTKRTKVEVRFALATKMAFFEQKYKLEENRKHFWQLLQSHLKSSFQCGPINSLQVDFHNVSRISFAGWKKATTNHASHQRALVFPVGRNMSEQLCLGKGSKKKLGKSMVFCQTPPRPPPPPPVWSFSRRKKLTPNFFFRNKTLIGWNKFYTWSHLKIYSFLLL